MQCAWEGSEDGEEAGGGLTLWEMWRGVWATDGHGRRKSRTLWGKRVERSHKERELINK